MRMILSGFVKWLIGLAPIQNLKARTMCIIHVPRIMCVSCFSYSNKHFVMVQEWPFEHMMGFVRCVLAWLVKIPGHENDVDAFLERYLILSVLNSPFKTHSPIALQELNYIVQHRWKKPGVKLLNKLKGVKLLNKLKGVNKNRSAYLIRKDCYHTSVPFY